MRRRLNVSLNKSARLSVSGPLNRKRQENKSNCSVMRESDNESENVLLLLKILRSQQRSKRLRNEDWR